MSKSTVQSPLTELERQYGACELVRPFRRACYDPGSRLEYQLTGVVPAHTGRIVAEVERAVGGGFAGQVYRVKLLEILADQEPIVGLTPGQHYAVKIMKPPSAFSRTFRDFLYFLAYQGRFSAQVHPASVRVGVLWQKLIRRAAAAKFGRESAVCDTFATFYDSELHSFGEINEWVDGRVWRFEVDDQLFSRWRYEGDVPADHNCPEYVHKKLFMGQIVDLLHQMGAPELARQYEWWSCKSQPNVLKRLDGEHSPAAGLTAVDFRAGLALLCFLPMSPVDVPLILRGLMRGRLAQFDRSNPRRLEQFVAEHQSHFEDLAPALAELQRQEKIHRASLPDVTHHHVRILVNKDLRHSIRAGAITAWEKLGHLDAKHAERLKGSWALFPLLWAVSWVPLLGRFLLRLWGNGIDQAHMWRCLRSPSYLWRAMRGTRIEALVTWQRAQRLSSEVIGRLVHRPVRFWLHRLFLSWLPPSWHRAAVDWSYAWSRLRQAVGFALRFLRVPEAREQWLLDQVRLGREEGMLSDTEAEKISAEIKDPYIQKYLRCLAVHVCTVPVTQVVMVLVGASVAAYCLWYQGLGWVESLAAGSAAGALIQLSPISPGSMARGLFVLYLMVKERDVRNYYIAAPVAFIHVVGYLAFPLQMVAHNPGLARFMAGRWAKSLVHVVPVFGESGGLLEHAVFDAFFNLPLSAKRSFKTRPVAWSAVTLVVAAAISFAGLLGYARLWEWRQPAVHLQGATVQSIVPYHQFGVEPHWSLRGMRVNFEGEPARLVDFPSDRWDGLVKVDDLVDAVIRKSFFGDEYDGLEIRRPGPK